MDKLKALPWIGKDYNKGIGGKRVLLEIRHPSTGFSTDYWNEAIRLFLEK